MALSGADLAGGLADAVAGAPGRWGVAVVADDGWTWSHDPDRVASSASTIKVPILLGVLRLVEQGRLRLDDDVPLAPPDDRVGGSGPLRLMRATRALPLVEALHLMIALSDNDATNAVLAYADLLGTDTVGDLLARVPTAHTSLRRRMMDLDAEASGLRNETTAGDLAAILVALREGRLLGEAMTRTAIEILRTQQLRDGLPAYLPQEVEVGSKTGDLPGLRADLALLERGGRWVAVAVLADGLHTGEAGGADRGTAILPVFAQIGELAAELLPTA